MGHGQTRVTSSIRQEAGLGTLHSTVRQGPLLSIHFLIRIFLPIDGVLYTILELQSEISAHRFDALPAESTLLSTVPTMSKFPGSITELNMLAAEILIPTPNSTFSTPYLYASNRNDPSPEGDVIAIFSLVDPEKPQLIAEVRSGLNHLRGMVFGGEDDKYLVAGGANGHKVKVFLRTDGGKGLQELAALDLQAPTAVLWA